MIKYCEHCEKCWIYLCGNERMLSYCKNCGYTQPAPVYDKSGISEDVFKEAFLCWIKNVKHAKVGLKESRSSYPINGYMCHIHLSKNHGKENQKYWTKIPPLDSQEFSIKEEKKHFLILISDYTAEDTYVINFDRLMITGGKDGWVWIPDSQGYYHVIIDKFDRLRVGGEMYSLKEFKNADHLIEF